MAERRRQQDQHGRQIQQDDLAHRSSPQRRKLADTISTDATADSTIRRRVRTCARRSRWPQIAMICKSLTSSIGTDRHWRAPVRMPGGRSEEHTSALQSLMRISYAVSCLKKKK